MSIILNRFNSDQKSSLIDVLQLPDPDKRFVVYYGVSIALVKLFLANFDLKLNKPELQLKINNLVNEIAEMAILDRTLFESIFNKVFNHFYNLMTANYNYNVFQISCVLSVFGIDDLFTQDDIALIDKQLELFKNAYVAAHDTCVSNNLRTFTNNDITFNQQQ